MTKKIVLLIALAIGFSAIQAKGKKKKEKEGYKFTEIKRLPATSVKDQNRSGTCWSFSTISHIESEMLRMGKKEVNLSEMFIVYYTYLEKAQKYVRMHGNLNFAGGGATHDVTEMIKKYGIVPEEAYKGLNYGTDKHVHGEFDAVLKGYVDMVIKNRNRSLSKSWIKGLKGILDGYLGEIPKEFTYEGKKYTPKSFAKERVGINPDDYVEITSYTHHPFYSQFIFEVPDNWMWGSVYNVPMNELKQVIDYALEKGYTLGWATDVSEKGFSWRNGLAVVPETNIDELAGSEKLKWSELDEKARKEQMFSFDQIVPEKKITQEMRQEGFDNYQTTDDHGMHITGTAKDQKGNSYYIVKNSWNSDSKYKGYLYASEAFVMYKTNYVMVHKDGVPDAIKSKLGIK